jgi:hypothetical protein
VIAADPPRFSGAMEFRKTFVPDPADHVFTVNQLVDNINWKY